MSQSTCQRAGYRTPRRVHRSTSSDPLGASHECSRRSRGGVLRSQGLRRSASRPWRVLDRDGDGEETSEAARPRAVAKTAQPPPVAGATRYEERAPARGRPGLHCTCMPHGTSTESEGLECLHHRPPACTRAPLAVTASVPARHARRLLHANHLRPATHCGRPLLDESDTWIAHRSIAGLRGALSAAVFGREPEVGRPGELEVLLA